MIQVEITPRAARRVRTLLAQGERSGRYGLRVAPDDTPRDEPGYTLSLVPAPREDELVLPRHGFDVYVAHRHRDRLDGVRVDYLDAPTGSGFLVDRPARRIPDAVLPPPGPEALKRSATGAAPDTRALFDRVAAALDGVRGVLLADGGDVELVGVEDGVEGGVEGGVAYVRLQGACSGCGAAALTLTQLIERAVATAVPEVPRTVLVA